jgi:hypothetical protein
MWYILENATDKNIYLQALGTTTLREMKPLDKVRFESNTARDTYYTTVASLLGLTKTVAEGDYSAITILSDTYRETLTTTEQVQDAIAEALKDSVDIDVTYDDANNEITAVTKNVNADKVDGCDVNDEGTDNKSLWTASKIADMVSKIANGTPVNAVNATKTLTISGAVADSETVSIGSDVYEFLADTAQSKTAETNIAVDITASTTKAQGTLTVDTNPTLNDTMTIGTTVYTFVENPPLNAGEIAIGTDVEATQINIVAAINGTDGVNKPETVVQVMIPLI